MIEFGIFSVLVAAGIVLGVGYYMVNTKNWEAERKALDKEISDGGS